MPYVHFSSAAISDRRRRIRGAKCVSFLTWHLIFRTSCIARQRNRVFDPRAGLLCIVADERSPRVKHDANDAVKQTPSCNLYNQRDATRVICPRRDGCIPWMIRARRTWYDTVNEEPCNLARIKATSWWLHMSHANGCRYRDCCSLFGKYDVRTRRKKLFLTQE